MKYRFKNGGVVKLQGAGLIPKLRTIASRLSRASKTAVELDKSLAGTPKVIEHVPQVTVSEPYARISRDLSTINTAWSFSIDGDPFNTFQLIKDIEPKYYSVHFKTLGRHALSEPQKQMLFKAVADAIPGGSSLSTWGSVSKGGLAGLKRFEGLGFKPTLQTRTLGLKMQPTVGEVFPFGELKADKIEVPVLYKPETSSKGVPTGNILSRYYDNGYNWENIWEDFDSGRKDAIDFLSSNTKAQTDTYNTALAKRLGFTKFKPSTNAQRAATPMKQSAHGQLEAWIGTPDEGFILDVAPIKDGIFASVARGAGNYPTDRMKINIRSDINDAALHEHLHRGEFGNAAHEPLSEIDFDTWKQQGDFYDFLGRKIIKPEYFNDEYVSNSEEIATNLFELGHRNGLFPGQSYPGKQQALKIFKDLENDPRKGIWMSYVRQDKPLRLWKGLTGTLFSVPILYKVNATENNSVSTTLNKGKKE